jgi:hypothetical protein
LPLPQNAIWPAAGTPLSWTAFAVSVFQPVWETPPESKNFLSAPSG